MLDAFQGPRYPRRYVQMPDHWDDTHQTQSENDPKLPEVLIERSSALEELVEEQQCIVVSLSAGRAEATLDSDEAEILAEHIAGVPLSKIARSRRWGRTTAHNVLANAKTKMRAALLRELYDDQEDRATA